MPSRGQQEWEGLPWLPTLFTLAPSSAWQNANAGSDAEDRCALFWGIMEPGTAQCPDDLDPCFLLFAACNCPAFVACQAALSEGALCSFGYHHKGHKLGSLKHGLLCVCVSVFSLFLKEGRKEKKEMLIQAWVTEQQEAGTGRSGYCTNNL
jgi:hypothetical protein